MRVIPQFLSRPRVVHRLVLAALSLATLVGVDVAAGRDLSLTPFYLILVLFAVWSTGMIWASAFLIASLFATMVIGEFYGHPIASRAQSDLSMKLMRPAAR